MTIRQINAWLAENARPLQEEGISPEHGVILCRWKLSDKVDDRWTSLFGMEGLVERLQKVGQQGMRPQASGLATRWGLTFDRIRERNAPMKITIIEHESSKIVPLEQFADLHGLEIEVKERDPDLRSRMHLCRFYASFPRIEYKKGGCLIGTSGNGETVEEAIADYAKCISGKLLVENAMNSSQREIQAPTLTYP